MPRSKIPIGCHVSISGSVDKAFDRAKALTCDTFQIFTKNPRGWKAKALSDTEINQFKEKGKNYGIKPVVAHISYLPNLTSLNPEVYEKSMNSFLLELSRAKLLSIPYFVIHCGSYKGGTFKEGMETFIKSVMKGIEISEGKVQILIENTAGGKNSIGGDFTNIQKILEEIDDPDAVKTCFDTCHAFVAGYDLRTQKAVAETMEIIESTIGAENIAIVHANDAKFGLKSHVDRHEHIGLGEIGLEGFKTMLNETILKEKPWILETPVDEQRGDRENIATLRSLIE